MPQSEVLDVQTFLNVQRFSRYQWLVFALCFLVVLMDGFDTAAIGYIAPSLIQEWGVSKADLGPVLGAALFGLAGGSLLAGPLADRLGRKRVLVSSVSVFALACLASSWSGSPAELAILRFFTGVGLGAAMPNAVTLMSEYCPDRRRAMITNAMFCGFPLGAALGGFLAAWMIPLWGWRSVLVLGGAAPLVLAVLLLAFLPESVRFMVSRGYSQERIRAVMTRISATAAHGSRFVMTEAKLDVGEKSGLAVLFSRDYAAGSVMLWVAYFMGLMIFYALINWMPILFKDAGVDSEDAILIAALFPLGGAGAVLFGWLMDRFNGNRVVAVGYLLTALAIAAVGQAAGSVSLLVLLVFVAGIFMNTAQTSMPALAAGFYPTRGRATGVAWMMAVGRFGGVAGSLLVAELSRRQLGFAAIFSIIAIPGAIAAIALLIKQWAHPEIGLEHSAIKDVSPGHLQEVRGH